ncbi:MAG: aspartate/glutamate racemase family protein [Oscillospiraceae bacterium]|nr:aspartate/glutamate racemase family protein [Oscillospiraceae bacterium]
MDARPIGIFDSGYGGLTAVRALRALCPEENLVFFADSGRAPYGGRSVPQLRTMARQDLAFVASFGAKAIIAACGTVSSNFPELLKSFPVPAIGVLEASVAEIRTERETGPIGVIATEATVRSGSFERALREACPGREVISRACPAFVPLIEAGRCGAEDRELREAAEAYLKPLKERGVRTLLLACTHYGLIAPLLDGILEGRARLVEASVCAARQMNELLGQRKLRGGEGRLRCLTSGPVERFERLAPLFLQQAEAPETLSAPLMPTEESL